MKLNKLYKLGMEEDEEVPPVLQPLKELMVKLNKLYKLGMEEDEEVPPVLQPLKELMVGLHLSHQTNKNQNYYSPCPPLSLDFSAVIDRHYSKLPHR
ncbi:hypothetical protein Q3G72_011727 [Acer saccharum]|nr:hypothetical protein Q3G72_011727 [Acer saccharum]